MMPIAHQNICGKAAFFYDSVLLTHERLQAIVVQSQACEAAEAADVVCHHDGVA
jgi:hypothetical protein